MKKLFVMLMVVVLVSLMTVSVGAVTLEQNSAMWSETYVGFASRGIMADVHYSLKDFMVFARGIPINRTQHSSFKYEVTKIEPDGERWVEFENNKTIDSYQYENDILYIAFSLKDTGPYEFKITLNTGESVTAGVFIIGEDESLEHYNKFREIEKESFKSGDAFREFVDTYYLQNHE